MSTAATSWAKLACGICNRAYPAAVTPPRRCERRGDGGRGSVWVGREPAPKAKEFAQRQPVLMFTASKLVWKVYHVLTGR